MLRKLMAILSIGLLLVACAPQAAPTPTPEAVEEEATEAVADATEAVAEEATEQAVEEEATEEATDEEATEAVAEEDTEATEEAAEESGTGAAATAWTCPEGFEGQTLSVYNWTTYVAEDTMSNFEELCGVSHTYTTFGGNEELLARIRAGNPGYDIIVPSDYVVTIMAAEDLLIPLDKSKIPNFANIGEIFLDPAYDPGNQYSVPYQWGTIGIGYDRTKVGEEITSYQQMFDYDGPVAWFDDGRIMLAIGLLVLGHDPNSTSEEEINEARDFLIANGENVIYLHQDDGQAYLERGEVDMTLEYSGDIFQLIAECECEDYAYTIPVEGANLWTDTLAIPADGPNPELAHVFIDYILDPQVGADISNYTGFGTPLPAALDQGLVDEALLEFYPIAFPPEMRERLYSAADIPEAEQLYADAWDEVKVTLGTG
jgi:spermidine/putrescine transport system substrate-binding protein